KGKGVQQDHIKALTWFQKAADQGYEPAQYNLGILYSHGQGVNKDYLQALKWYQKAAKQGKAIDQFLDVGVLYIKGIGTKRAIKQGINWLQEAAKQGDDVAKKMLLALQDKGMI